MLHFPKKKNPFTAEAPRPAAIHTRPGRPLRPERGWLPMAVGLVVLLGAASALAQDATNDGNMRGWLGVNLFKMLGDTEVVGMLCLILLAFFSLASWMVIVYKVLHLRQATSQTDEFVERCNESDGSLETAYAITEDYPDSPLAQILREAYLELEVEDWYRSGYNLDTKSRLELGKIGIERIFERTISNEITHLESKVIFLATTSSVCPFIGLFGTVWGIMAAFQSLTVTGTASLNQLAPGLSTALITTVGGLFVAIPASVMYNYLTHQVRVMVNRMDAFALELGNVIQKQMMKQSN